MRPVNQESWDFEDVPTKEDHDKDYWCTIGKALHRLAGVAVASAGVKQGAVLAADVGANPTQFSEALKEGGVKRFAIEWLPRLIATPEGIRILRLLCKLRGMEPKPLPILSPEEKLRRLVARIESKGRSGRALIEEEFGEEQAEALVRSSIGENA